MRYRDELPPDCPPPGAREITGRRIVHHVVRRLPPAPQDFRSQRQRQRRPEADRSASDECIAAGLSVFADPAEMAGMQRRGYFARRIICRIELGPGAILKTHGGSHYTWRPVADWDIAGRCSGA